MNEYDFYHKVTVVHRDGTVTSGDVWDLFLRSAKDNLDTGFLHLVFGDDSTLLLPVDELLWLRTHARPSGEKPGSAI